jgi:hypothetical protein
MYHRSQVHFIQRRRSREFTTPSDRGRIPSPEPTLFVIEDGDRHYRLQLAKHGTAPLSVVDSQLEVNAELDRPSYVELSSHSENNKSGLSDQQTHRTVLWQRAGYWNKTHRQKDC